MTSRSNGESVKIIIAANTSWLLENFQTPFIRELQSRQIEVVALAPWDESSRRLEMGGVRHVNISIARKGLNPIADLGLLVQFCRIYNAERPDYVFHNTIKPVIYGSIAARLVGLTNVVNMIPGLGYVFIQKGIRHRMLRLVVTLLYRHALKQFRPVFFQNPDDKEFFVRNGIVKESVAKVTFGYGVDIHRFRPTVVTRGNRNCTFLLVARMLWDKGVGDFVEAAKIVKRTSPEARFQLLGRIDKDNPSGIDLTTIEKWVSLGHVEYLGEVADVRDIVAKADVIVLPSYYREGTPSSLMEGLAMGKPLITTDMPGCRETVVDGINGILVKPRDAHGLAEAMKFMIQNPGRRIEMGKEARKLAVQRFDVRTVNASLLAAMGLESDRVSEDEIREGG